jgi:hypothetical protein
MSFFLKVWGGYTHHSQGNLMTIIIILMNSLLILLKINEFQLGLSFYLFLRKKVIVLKNKNKIDLLNIFISLVLYAFI